MDAEAPIKHTEMRRQALLMVADQRVTYYPYDDGGQWGISGTWESKALQMNWLLAQKLIAIGEVHRQGRKVTLTNKGQTALSAAGEF